MPAPINHLKYIVLHVSHSFLHGFPSVILHPMKQTPLYPPHYKAGFVGRSGDEVMARARVLVTIVTDPISHYEDALHLNLTKFSHRCRFRQLPSSNSRHRSRLLEQTTDTTRQHLHLRKPTKILSLKSRTIRSRPRLYPLRSALQSHHQSHTKEARLVVR